MLLHQGSFTMTRVQYGTALLCSVALTDWLTQGVRGVHEQYLTRMYLMCTSGPLTRPQGRHALVDPFHGRKVRAVTHHHPPDLGGVRPAAAPVRDIQAVHRSAICRQGAGHSRALHVAAEPGDRAVRG